MTGKTSPPRTVDEITGSRRFRRLRKSDWSRRLVAEHRLSVDDLIWPLFLTEGENRAEDITAMPGVQRYSIDRAVRERSRARRGVQQVETRVQRCSGIRRRVGVGHRAEGP